MDDSFTYSISGRVKSYQEAFGIIASFSRFIFLYHLNFVNDTSFNYFSILVDDPHRLIPDNNGNTAIEGTLCQINTQYTVGDVMIEENFEYGKVSEGMTYWEYREIDMNGNIMLELHVVNFERVSSEQHGNKTPLLALSLLIPSIFLLVIVRIIVKSK